MKSFFLFLPLLLVPRAFATRALSFDGEGAGWTAIRSPRAAAALVQDSRLVHPDLSARYSYWERGVEADGTDANPLRITCRISDTVENPEGVLPAVMQVQWENGDFLAIGPQALGNAWWQAGKQAGQRGSGLGLPRADHPVHLRLVLTTRRVSAFASLDGDRFVHVVSHERANGRFSGKPSVLRVGRLSVVPGGEGANTPDRDAERGAGARAVIGPMWMETDDPSRSPPEGLADYERQSDPEDTADVYRAGRPPKGWILSGPFRENNSKIPVPGGEALPGIPFAVPEEWNGEIDGGTVVTKNFEELVAHLRWPRAKAGPEWIRFEGLERAELFLNGERVLGPLQPAYSLLGKLPIHAIRLDLREGENILAVRLFGRGSNRRFRLVQGHAANASIPALWERILSDFPDDTGDWRKTALRESAWAWTREGLFERAAESWDLYARQVEGHGQRAALARAEALRNPWHLEKDAGHGVPLRQFLDPATDVKKLAHEWMLRDPSGYATSLTEAADLLERLYPDLALSRRMVLGELYLANGLLSDAEALVQQSAGLFSADPLLRERLAFLQGQLRSLQSPRPNLIDAHALGANLATAVRLAGEGEFAQAVDMFHALFASDPLTLLGESDRIFIALQEKVAATIRRQDPALWSAYRAKVDPLAATDLGLAKAEDDTPRLWEITRIHRLSQGAAEALNLLGDEAMRAGNFHQAADLYGRLVLENPGRSPDPALAALKLADALAATGESERAASVLLSLGANRAIPFRGQTLDPKAHAATLRVPPEQKPSPRIADAGFSTPFRIEPRDVVPTLKWWPYPYRVHPTRGRAAGERILFNTSRGIFAVRAGDGAMAWSTEPILPALERDAWTSYGTYPGLDPASRGNLDGWFSPQVAVGADLAFFLVHRRAPRKDRNTSADWVIEARELETGALRWSTESHADVQDMDVVSSPAYSGGSVFVVLRDSSLNPEFFLASLSARDGALLWRRTLGQVIKDDRSTEDIFSKWHAKITQEWIGPPTVAHGTVYAALGNGLVAALSAGTGEVRWLHAYVPDWSNSIGTRIQKIRYLREPPQVLVRGDRAVVLPRDSQTLLCLDTRNGRVEWTRPLCDARSLSAWLPREASEGLILLEGWDVEAVDAETGHRAWRLQSRPEHGWFVSGLLGEARSLRVPAERGLLRVNADTGAVEGFDPWESLGTREAVGNLFEAEGHLFGFAEGKLVRLGKRPPEPPKTPPMSPPVFPAGQEPVLPLASRMRWGGGRSEILHQDGKRVLARVGEELLCFVPGDTGPRWRIRPGHHLQDLQVIGDRLALVSRDRIRLHDLATGEALWSGWVHGKTSPWEELRDYRGSHAYGIRSVHADGAHLLIFHSEVLLVKALRDGSEVLRLEPGEGVTYRSALLAGDTLIAQSNQRSGGELLAFDLDGNPRWSTPVPGPSERSLLRVDGKTIWLLRPGGLSSFDTATGTALASITFPSERQISHESLEILDQALVIRQFAGQREHPMTSHVLDRQGQRVLISHDGGVALEGSRVLALARRSIDNPGNVTVASALQAYDLSSGKDLWTLPAVDGHQTVGFFVRGQKAYQLLARGDGTLRLRVLATSTGKEIAAQDFPHALGRIRENARIGGTNRTYEPLAFSLPEKASPIAIAGEWLYLGTDQGLVHLQADAATKPDPSFQVPPRGRPSASPMIFGEGAFRVTARLSWDETFLHVDVETEHPVVSLPALGAPPLSGDSILVGIQTFATPPPVPPGEEASLVVPEMMFSVALVGGRAEVRHYRGPEALRPRLAELLPARVDRDGNILRHAVRIPLAALGIPNPQPGLSLRFGLAALDHDRTRLLESPEWGAGLLNGFFPAELPVLTFQP